MDLLEREPHLCLLRQALAESRAGAGRMCLVSGEAGIGKTSLVERFAAELMAADSSAEVLWGTCDALFTPRPLGPLFDIARHSATLRGAFDRAGSDREQLFRTMLNVLTGDGAATVVVFEDAHWADEATLDLLKFLGRRIREMSALIVITYRDDELGRTHPLWHLLGELPRGLQRRISLPPLSAAAVNALADRSGRDATGLHARTRGNPFFVTEVLANEDAAAVPDSVLEAVFARAARLSQQARLLLDIVAVVPGRIERSLLPACGGSSAALEECIGSGVLTAGSEHAWFRHDLARQAWEGAIESSRRRELHACLLHALTRKGECAADAARLVHHAAGSGDGPQVLHLAPAAAEEAARLGSHRDAAAILAVAIQHAELLPAAEHAALLDRFAFECNLAARVGEAVAAQERSLEIWRRLGDRLREGNALRFLSRLYWYRGEGELVSRYAAEATEILEPLGPTAELATAYGSRAQLHMLRQETEEALAWGQRAITLARSLDNANALMYALNTVGTAMIGRGDFGGRALLEESLALAQERNRHADVTRAYCNLASTSAEWYEWDRARDYVDAGLRYCDRWGIDTQLLCMISDGTLIRMYQGHWSEAAADAAALLRRPGAQTVQRVPALVTLARIRARRSEPVVDAPLAEARELARRSEETQRILPASIALAEIAWLEGRPVTTMQDVMAGYQLALVRGTPWLLGELAYWLWRCGAVTEPPAGCAEPYALQIRGEWRAAAAAWEQMGCPYQHALALAEGGDHHAVRLGLSLLEQLGARAVVERLRRELHARGVTRVPRGPRPSTRQNPAQLTRRQLDVLRLLGGGLTNDQIAQKLFLSPKTVAHHVSAILHKLHARTRAEAVASMGASGASKMGN